jgi:choline dehydrogenase-like flavoprotein
MKQEHYDVIIIGSGFGGSTAAFALSKAGLKTVLLEKGGWAKRDDFDWDPREILIKKRYRSDSPVYIDQNSGNSHQKVMLNEVVGGNSIFFGGTAIRFREKDFETWPVTYGEFEKYYTLAEKLLEVSGEAHKDPNEPYRSDTYCQISIPLSEPSKRIFNAAESLGLSPFKLPLAINFRNKSRIVCLQCTTCDGYPCKIEAKNDAATMFLKQAQEYNCTILTNTIVNRVYEKNGTVTMVEFIDKKTKKTHTLSAKIVIVSAGTLQSPGILLRSGLERYSNHKNIGSYLMRHCSAIVSGIFPIKTNAQKVFQKQVGITHFYEDLREKLNTSTGMIQDIYMPSAEIVKYYAPMGIKLIASMISDHCQNLICIAEDDPVYENKIELSGKIDAYGINVISVNHRYTKNDIHRREHLVKHSKKILRKAGAIFSKVLGIDETTPPTFSHAVGSVRFGNDLESSVLDKHCKFFGIKNLYVVDGSFMRSSAGVNPSLTITANALRVSEHIVQNIHEF